MSNDGHITSPLDARGGIVVAGHVCLDVIPQLSAAVDVRPGTLTHIGPAATATGGAVANVGLALHRLGVPVSLIGRIGDDVFGREVLRLLSHHGPALVRQMSVHRGAVTSYSLVISPPGVDRSFLHCPGANDEFGAADVDPEELGGARILHFGYPPIMRRTYADGGQEVSQIFAAAQRRGIATSLDLCAIDPASDAGKVDWRAWLATVLPHVDLFLPSLDETLTALRMPATNDRPDVDTLRRVADELHTLGAGVIVLKLGADGLYAKASGDAARLKKIGGGLLEDVPAWRGREFVAPCFRASVVGTTGSGDCTIAGFLAAVLRGASLERALVMATAVGACSVEAADAVGGVCRWDEVERRVAAGWERHAVGVAGADAVPTANFARDAMQEVPR